MTYSERDYTRLTDGEWSSLKPILATIPGIYLSTSDACRQFLEAVLWVSRTGAQWRSLPADRGHWNSVFKRFDRWAKQEIWGKFFELNIQHTDLQSVSIDGTVIRAHACAAGAAHSTAEKEALGRSRGGFGCKIHAAVNTLGLPIKFILTPGQSAEITQAIPLMEGIDTKACLADKGYDSNEFRDWLQEKKIKVVIPPKSNRKSPIPCDYLHYKDRHVVKCTFGALKYFRRISSRFEKKAINFMAMLNFAAVMRWLR